MSAFLCNHEHIGLLAAYHVGKRTYHGKDTVLDVARILAEANIASMKARYGDAGCDDPEAYLELCEKEALRAIPDTVGPVLILKMCDCLEYQSCEVEGYRETKGFQVLDAIRGTAVRCIGGYEDAPGWEYSRASYAKWLDEKRAKIPLIGQFRK